MFHKQFRVKSNVRMKSSDRKKLRALIEARYSHVSPEEASSLCPAKEDVTQLKVACHNGESATVYCVGKDPLLFELPGDRLFPTVYALWRVPGLLSHLTTWDRVLERLSGGADLMAPGVVRCSSDEMRRGDAVAIRTTRSGAAAVAVGSLLVDPAELASPDRRGKAVAVAHVYGDCLWAHGSKAPLPDSGSKEDSGDSEDEDEEAQEADSRGDEEGVAVEGEGEMGRGEEATVTEKSVVPEDVPEKEVEQGDDADALLDACVLSALSRKPKLPVLSSTFYSAHVLPCCPPGRTLDIRKTSHKKLSTYLSQLQMEGLLEVKELTPGVQSIVSVNQGHPLLRGVNVLPLAADVSEETTAVAYSFPTVRELRTVTAAVQPLFRGCSKGQPLSVEEVRKRIRVYVRENEVQTMADRRSVVLDPVLADVVTHRGDRPEALPWEELFQRVLSRMQFAHEVAFPGEAPQVRKGALEPISVSVAQRTGNKKVTLVDGLETYGIDPHRFAHEVQVGVAASTTVNPAPRGGQQVLVQGNQVVFLEKLLTGPNYGVPRKYIRGLENAPKKKKK